MLWGGQPPREMASRELGGRRIARLSSERRGRYRSGFLAGRVGNTRSNKRLSAVEIYTAVRRRVTQETFNRETPWLARNRILSDVPGSYSASMG